MPENLDPLLPEAAEPEVSGMVESRKDRLRGCLEARVGQRLRSREALKRAYGAVTGMRGPGLEEEFAIASGETVSGDTQVVGPDGKLEDDPLDVWFAERGDTFRPAI